MTKLYSNRLWRRTAVETGCKRAPPRCGHASRGGLRYYSHHTAPFARSNSIYTSSELTFVAPTTRAQVAATLSATTDPLETSGTTAFTRTQSVGTIYRNLRTEGPDWGYTQVDAWLQPSGLMIAAGLADLLPWIGSANKTLT